MASQVVEHAATMFMQSPDPMWALSKNMKLTAFNDAFRRLMVDQYHVDPTEGHGIEVLEAQAAQLHGRTYAYVLRGNELRMDWRTPDNETTYDILMKPMVIDEDVVGVLAYCWDVTERRQAVIQLEEAKALAERARVEAEKANEAKSEFLAHMSHEIRTPLNAIVGLTQLLLRQGELPERSHLLLSKVSANSEALLHLVSDVLDFRQMEAGLMSVGQHSFSIVRTVSDVVEFLRVRAEEKRLELSFTADLDLPNEVIGDAQRLRQVVTNLVGNAIKYTPRGSVEVKLSIEERKENLAILLLEVIDTGFGIVKREQDLIFTKFYRAYASSSGRATGTGLGLAITKQLVELMGGTIGVESERGRGARFWVRLALPVAAWTERSVNVVGLQALKMRRSARILVADDNADNQAVCAALLTRGGDIVECVDDGAEALEAVKNQGPWDVVLMDVDMPVMDGIQATVEIRSWQATRGLSRTPIFALTAHDDELTRVRCIDSGMDEFMVKPVQGQLLSHKIEQHVDRRPKVLIVDDAPDSRLVLTGAIEGAGGVVVAVESCMRAVQAVVADEPDLIVVDHELPDGIGPSLVARLRKGGFVGPIVGYTGHTEAIIHQAWERVGANGVMVKPMALAEIVRQLQDLLQPNATQEVLVAPVSLPEGIDPDLADLIPLFLEERRKDLRKLRVFVKNRRFEDIKNSAHRMKGTGTSYGYPAVTQIGGELEHASQAQDAEACSALIERLAVVLA